MLLNANHLFQKKSQSFLNILPWKQQATMEVMGIREQTEHIAGEASEQQCLMPLWWERTLHTIIELYQSWP